MPFFTPVGGGGLPKATVTGTTGSPNVNTTSRPGRTIYTFNGSGSITFGQAGTCEVFLAGGGGGTAGGNGNMVPGAGAGGYVLNTSAVVPAGTFTVTVGAGAAGGTSGQPIFGCAGFPSSIHTLFTALGGGQSNLGNALQVASGGSGGGSLDSVNSGVGLVGQGNNGGRAISGSGRAGGGGAGAVGTDTNGTANGRAGGAGLSNTITGSSVTYCGGGGGGAGNGGSGGAGGAGGGGAGSSPSGPGGNGTANTGGGGGGYSDPGGFGPFSGGSGGSGVVIVVIG